VRVQPCDPPLDPAVVDEQQAWSSPESLEYYRHHRRSAEELYPSERFFLPDVLRQVDSMLDVGCAAGGFSEVVRAFNPRVRYVGVDIAPAFVAMARAAHPHAEFVLGDGLSFPTPAASFDLVHASGVLHLNLRYRDMIAAMWHQTRRFLLCDLRLTTATPEVGRMQSPFGEAQATSLPYVVLDVPGAMEIFRALEPAPARVSVKGYRHHPSTHAKLDNPDLLMAFVLAEKTPGSAATTFDLDLNG
jgi:SAM-dependent methyltransferase